MSLPDDTIASLPKLSSESTAIANSDLATTPALSTLTTTRPVPPTQPPTSTPPNPLSSAPLTDKTETPPTSQAIRELLGDVPKVGTVSSRISAFNAKETAAKTPRKFSVKPLTSPAAPPATLLHRQRDQAPATVILLRTPLSDVLQQTPPSSASATSATDATPTIPPYTSLGHRITQGFATPAARRTSPWERQQPSKLCPHGKHYAAQPGGQPEAAAAQNTTTSRGPETGKVAIASLKRQVDPVSSRRQINVTNPFAYGGYVGSAVALERRVCELCGWGKGNAKMKDSETSVNGRPDGSTTGHSNMTATGITAVPQEAVATGASDPKGVEKALDQAGKEVKAPPAYPPAITPTNQEFLEAPVSPSTSAEGISVAKDNNGNQPSRTVQVQIQAMERQLPGLPVVSHPTTSEQVYIR